MAKFRFSHTRYVLPLIAVTLSTCLSGCSPPSGTDAVENPFEAKDLPEDENNKNRQEAKCGEHKCGGGIE